MLALREEVEPLALAFGKRSPNARAALQCYYRQPVIWARKLETELQISQPTANALIQGFVKKGVLKELTSRRRNRLYVFDRYLQLFEK